jgi:hypothetical protein
MGAIHIAEAWLGWVAPNLSCLHLLKRVFSLIGTIHSVIAGLGWVARFVFAHLI